MLFVGIFSFLFSFLILFLFLFLSCLLNSWACLYYLLKIKKETETKTKRKPNNKTKQNKTKQQQQKEKRKKNTSYMRQFFLLFVIFTLFVILLFPISLISVVGNIKKQTSTSWHLCWQLSTPVVWPVSSYLMETLWPGVPGTSPPSLLSWH